jgi:hypothetical protein
VSSLANRGADVDVRVVAGTPLSIVAESDARISAQGQIPRLEARLEAGAELRARGLVTRDVRLEGNGESKAFVCATSKLDVELSGRSEATCYCHPSDVDRELSGSSSLDHDD